MVFGEVRASGLRDEQNSVIALLRSASWRSPFLSEPLAYFSEGTPLMRRAVSPGRAFTPVVRAFRRADDGTRTQDLLHGNSPRCVSPSVPANHKMPVNQSLPSCNKLPRATACGDKLYACGTRTAEPTLSDPTAKQLSDTCRRAGRLQVSGMWPSARATDETAATSCEPERTARLVNGCIGGQRHA